MKKIVSLLLALCMLLSVGAALAEDKVELTAFQYALENQNTDFNGLWFFDELEAKTNTHVTFDMVKDADWSTRHDPASRGGRGRVRREPGPAAASG